MTTGEAARRLGVTQRSVQNYVNDGLLRAEKKVAGLDFRWEIEEADLVEFARRHSIPLKETDDE
jgi:excisionase family DNA binding protein